jgi:16S rRNA (cytosine967-C5)-methyltransferase
MANKSDPIWSSVRWLQEDVGVFEGDLSTITQRSDCTIQNVTQAQLMQRLAQGVQTAPKRILDLCAAPGGKTLMLRDLYPDAWILANDISAKRLERLHENQRKYGMAQQISCLAASDLQTDQLFDLVVVDAPCSNSGVLHKRPEARWRLDQPNNLQETQRELLTQARRLLAPGGVIWYLTCSILSCENQQITGQPGQLILPNSEGWDGGYAAQVA